MGLGENKIRTVTYFLPEKEQFSRMAIHYLNNLNKHNLEIKLICRSSVSELFNLSMHHSDMLISDKQLNRFGLPHPSTNHKMNQIFSDAAVDLNPEFDPVHGILMQKINISDQKRKTLELTKKNLNDVIELNDSMDTSLEEFFAEIDKIGIEAFLAKWKKNKK